MSLPKTDFKGYLVETWFASKDGVYDLGSTAIDVSFDWTKFPRYGYLSMFENVSDSTVEYNIERLNKFHINGIQYYDWQYKQQLNMVLAAYMNYKVKGGDFNKHAVLLTDAVIFASGGSHIELGDSGMLSHEYFPNDKLKVNKELNSALREYYDFMVAYQNYLRDGQEKIKPKVVSDTLDLSTRPSNNKE